MIKGILGNNWPDLSKGNQYIKCCINVKFPEFYKGIALCKGCSQEAHSKVLGRKGSWCLQLLSQVLQNRVCVYALARSI